MGILNRPKLQLCSQLTIWIASHARTIASLRKRRVKRAPRTPELTDWADFFAEVICSIEIGVLKAENARRFFGAVLSAHGLQFSDALLLEDRADNCEAFRQQSESAIHGGWALMSSVKRPIQSAIGRFANAQMDDIRSTNPPLSSKIGPSCWHQNLVVMFQ